ncbi:MAG: hypothetical protein V8Q40_09275 [Anaerosacchariphilus sp.]
MPIASSYYESGMNTGYVLKDGMSSETLNGPSRLLRWTSIRP